MDSFHTLLNVVGNTAHAVLLERWEPQSGNELGVLPVNSEVDAA
jgi:proton glutamate symport protein